MKEGAGQGKVEIIDSKMELAKSEPKVISIMHQCTMRKPWILMPIGYYYNRDLQNAKQGDILLFSDGKRREIEYKTIVPIINGLTDYLCRKTYVGGMQNVMRRWRMNAISGGANEKVYSHDECLLIFLKETPVMECTNAQCNKREL